jgi:hypothetical protein
MQDDDFDFVFPARYVLVLECAGGLPVIEHCFSTYEEVAALKQDKPDLSKHKLYALVPMRI